MAGSGCMWSRRVAARARTLRGLVRDTQRALRDVSDVLEFQPDIEMTVQEIGNLSHRSTALVILGTTQSARVRLLHALLGKPLLPDNMPRGCRWIQIQYGSSTQVHLSLGNSEFELVEELECNKRPWETLPLEDLLRQGNPDCSTILEVEMNNQFLKEGLRIIIPPDIDKDPGTSDRDTLKSLHSELYNRRNSILKTINPVYLYAIDRTAKNFFSDSICGLNFATRSEEDFWNIFNLYHMTRVNSSDDVGQCVSDKCVNKSDETLEEKFKEILVPSVFTSENCLDLHQVKDINANSQLLFILFSDSVSVDDKSVTEELCTDATESTEATCTSGELPESDQDFHGIMRHALDTPEHKPICDNRRLQEEQTAFMNELLDQWEVMTNPPQKHYIKSRWLIVDDAAVLRAAEEGGAGCAGGAACAGGAVRGRAALLAAAVRFAADAMDSCMLEACTSLSRVHVKLLQHFILASFDLARELQVVPKKIQYAARQERQLFETINEKFCEGEKKRELLVIMHEVLQEMKVEVNGMDWSVDDLPCHQDHRFLTSNSTFYTCRTPDTVVTFKSGNNPSVSGVHPGVSGLHPGVSGLHPGISELQPSISESRPSISESHPAIETDLDASEGEEAVSYDSYNFNDYEIIDSTGRGRYETSETYVTHSRSGAETCDGRAGLSVKQASLDVQHTVLSYLSNKISTKLVEFLDCLKDSYFGTLQRCVESLEGACRAELGGRPASAAVRRLLAAPAALDLRPAASFSPLRALVHSLRRLLRLSGDDSEEACCVLSPVWRRRAAAHTVASLTPQRLARIISHQILEGVFEAHERYQGALAALQAALATRLHHTEDIKLAIRKRYAPMFARLCLESTSMCDLLMYGIPELGREIGRGQYGVVYSARGAWGGHSPVAVKSVLPADERHYQELAMEFFYTRSIPPHPNIVRLYGSVVQRRGGGGGRCGIGPGVLLVSERKWRDLHHAVRAGLPAPHRMRVAADIVCGIRYLHSLGLVHRDIKMKNVLLDVAGRGSLSDLGFCAAEALMSGSVVGTPVHMAPELLAGEYDASVDVYAFGILFWYVCAGNVKLPSAFEMFMNKEQLWSRVKRGLRPERLPHFTDECWEVMTSCWHSEPSQRALLGDVQLQLEKIIKHTTEAYESEPSAAGNTGDSPRDDVSEDSLDMTGIDGNVL